MPGANYMGGKRNAMQARVKDTIRRQQKVFFGNRRLDMLSQGLSASKPSGKPQLPSLSLSSNRGWPDIDLAHARQKIPLEDDADMIDCIPKAVHASLAIQSKLKSKNDAHTLSIKPSKSKVLDALDAADPFFLRRSLDRILAMPDLAYLSNKQDCGVKKQIDAEGEIPMGRKRKRMEEDFDPRGKITIKKTSHKKYSGSHWSINNSGAFWTNEECQDGKHLQTSGSKYKIGQSIGKGTPDDYHRRQTSSRDDNDHHHEKFSNFDNTGSLSSPAFIGWSEESYGSPFSLPFSSSHKNTPSPCKKAQATWKEEESDESDNLDQNTRLPSRIKLRPTKVANINSVHDVLETEESVFGSLFEQLDPWFTIGCILGLVDIEPPRQEEITSTEDDTPNGWQYSFLGRDGFFDNIYELEDETSGNELLLDECCQTDKPVPYSSNPSSAVLTTKHALLLGMQSDDENNDMNMCVSDEQRRSRKTVDASPGIRAELWEKEIIPGEKRKVQPPTESEMEELCSALDFVGPTLLVETQQEDTETGASHDVRSDLPGEDSKIEESSRNANAADSVVHHSENPEDANSARILVSPVLREVNGRFLGPALLSKFDESEDES